MTKRNPSLSQREVTGEQLAAELEAFLDRRPDVSRKRLAAKVYKWSGGIKQLRGVCWPTPRLVERARSLIANPPPELLKKPMGRPPTGRKAERRIGYARPPRPVQSERRVAHHRRIQNAKALARIEAGIAPSGGAQRLAQQAMRAVLEERKRQQDPIEQAKIALRKRYTPVFDGAVVGRPGVFVVGTKTLCLDEMLAMAGAL